MSSARSRSLASRLSIVGAAVLVAAAPVLFMAPAANADASFAVTTPSQGQVGVPEYFPNTAQFAGVGLSDGNSVDVQYVTGDGSLHTAIYGGSQRQADGSWTAVANFDLLGAGQTQVVSTVNEVDAEGTVLQSRPLTFTLAVAPNPADPFTVTYPGTLQTVGSKTPTFTGTGQPGATVVITYGARSLTTAEAGRGIVDSEGNFAIVTDFSRLEPGAGTEATGGTRAIFTQTLNGEEIPGAERLAVAFSFAEAPVALIPLTLTVDPTSLTVADVTNLDKGLSLAATGFSPGERLFVSLVGPDGQTIDLTTGDIFASEEDGSFADTLTLLGDVATGGYTVTLAGERSERTVSADFTVVANPVTPAGTTPGSTGGRQLAATGFDGAPYGVLAGGLVLGGLALALIRRRATV